MEKKLYRSYKDKMLGGVAGGIGEYFEIDSTIIRIIFLVTLFMGGTGIIAYLILWVLVPQQIFIPNMVSADSNSQNSNIPKSNLIDNYFAEQEEKKNKRSMTLGIILIVFGVIFLADNFLPRISFGDFWPILLIGIGTALLLNSKKN
ncbi:MAG: PspC domain-containing protein [Ignavibacteriales bacterium]|nr:MAG: PspC domain-containing protein [Ignavibacteriales bacterium]